MLMSPETENAERGLQGPDTNISEWETPELIVIERQTPEESVLCACKSDSNMGPDTITFNMCVRVSYDGACTVMGCYYDTPS